jgi:hypothetical protein
VTTATLTTIRSPHSRRLPVGFVTQFTAIGIYSDNTARRHLLATWSSDAPNSDSVGTKGRVSPLAAGSAKISASYRA